MWKRKGHLPTEDQGRLTRISHQAALSRSHALRGNEVYDASRRPGQVTIRGRKASVRTFRRASVGMRLRFLREDFVKRTGLGQDSFH